MSESEFQIQYVIKAVSKVAYVPQEDAIIEYWIDRNYVFYTCPPKMGTELGVCPIENFDLDRFEPICDL